MTGQQTQHHCRGGGFFATTAAANINHPTTTSAAGNKQCHDCGYQSLKRSSSVSLQEPTPKKLNLHGFSRIALPLSNQIEPAKHSLHRTFSVPTTVNSPPQPPPLSALPFLNPHSPPENVPIVIRRAVSDITSPEFNKPSIQPSQNVCVTLASPSPPSSASQPPIPRRSVADITSPAFQQALSTITPSLERTVSLTPSCNSDSSTRGRSPSLERMKIMDEMAKEISEWCKETMRQMQQVDDDDDEVEEEDAQEEEASEQIEEEEAEDGAEDNHHLEEEKEKALTEPQEAVSVDRVGDCLTIHFACPCGKGYQILLSGKSCYYKLVPC